MAIARLPSIAEGTIRRQKSGVSPATSKPVSRTTSGAYEDPDPYSEKPNSKVIRQLSIAETVSRQMSFMEPLPSPPPAFTMLNKGSGKTKHFLSPIDSPSKRWSNMYVKRVNFTQDTISTVRHNESNALIHVVTCVMLLKRAAKRFLKRLHQKLALAKLSCKKQTSLEHFQWAPPFQEWRSDWGRQLHCCICHKPVITDSSHCKFCGVVGHRLCIIPLIRANALNVPPRNPGEHAALTLAKYFTCKKCTTVQKDEQAYYSKAFEDLKEQRTKDYYRNVISMALVEWIRRKRIRKLAHATTLVRFAMNRFILMKQYKAWRRSCLRVLVLDLTSLPHECMNERCLVVLTVVDPIKHSQLFRIDKKPELVLGEGYLLPGISGHMTIALTICVKRDDSQHTFFAVSQMIFALRDIDDFISRQTIPLFFSKQMMWMPTDPKKEHAAHVIPLPQQNNPTSLLSPALVSALGLALPKEDDLDEAAAEEAANADDAESAGPYSHHLSHIGVGGAAADEVDLDADTTRNGTNSSTSRSTRTPPRKSSAIAAHIPLSPLNTTMTTVSPNRFNPSSPPGKGPSTAPPSTAQVSLDSPAPVLKAATIIAQLLSPNLSFVGKLIFSPRCPISTVCVWGTGPPLDVLRKVTDVTKTNKNKSLNILAAMNAVENQARRRKWWMILSDLKLYFFEQYGDPKPKLIADILNVTLNVRKVPTTTVSFVFSDHRMWSFEFLTLMDANNFEFAIIQTQKCLLGEPGSSYLRASDVMSGRLRQIGGTVLTVC